MLEIKVKEFLCLGTPKKFTVYVSHKLLRVIGLTSRDRAEVKEAMPKKVQWTQTGEVWTSTLTHGLKKEYSIVL